MLKISTWHTLAILTFVFFANSVLADALPTLSPWPAFYQKRYPLSDTNQKLVSNTGDGWQDLYGVRNFRMVLKGVLYRGGANNAYFQPKPKDNMNPLPEEGIANLCSEGFSTAVYLYKTNFNSVSHFKSCHSVRTPNNDLTYLQESPTTELGMKSIFREVLASISDSERGPVYIHCWNGWHASGLASALSLRQFCDVSASEAVAYWDRNTDGVNQDPAYEKVRNTIRQFTPYPEFKISEALKRSICPSL